MKLEGKTNAELLTMRAEIEARPESRNPLGSVHIFTKTASKKLDAITAQVTHNLAVARSAAGNPVPCNGYSGRKSNRK